MSYLGNYLDQLIEQHRFRSDTELARFLGISRQHISRVRKTGILSDEKCMIIAKELGIDPLELFSYMRAQKSSSEDVRGVWLDLHRKTKRVKDFILLNRNIDDTE